MTLYLVRHAMTEANLQGLVLGAGDSPLAPGGRDAARRLGASLAGRGIAWVACSPLGRARDTARIIGDILGADRSAGLHAKLNGHAGDGLRRGRTGSPVPGLILLPGLAELSCGQWEGRPRGQVRPEGGSLRRSWTDSPPGGESYAQAEPRVGAALADLADLAGDEPGLLVGHAVVNRLVLALAARMPRPWLTGFTQPHERAILLTPGLPPTWLDTGRPLLEGIAAPGNRAPRPAVPPAASTGRRP